MVQIDAEVTGILLARAFTEIHEAIATDGSPVRQDAAMPASVRRALSLVSAHCLLAGPSEVDLGSSVHVMMARACEPFGEWGLPDFSPPFRFSDVALVDGDNSVPTDDCRELAKLGGGGEVAVREEIHHERLMEDLKKLSSRQRSATYTLIREFCVRNPAVTDARLNALISANGLLPVARTVTDFYRPVPLAAQFGGVAHRCAHCHSLLWPDRDAAAFPAGRCRIKQCRLAHPKASLGEVIERPEKWRLASKDILAFWVGPGLDEIRIFDALRTKGRVVVLYPLSDAADVGVDGLRVGIDVKTYASPILLGAKLTRSIGRLATFKRKIIAVPDDKLRLNPGYLDQLRVAYAGAETLEFRTTGSLIEEFTA